MNTAKTKTQHENKAEAMKRIGFVILTWNSEKHIEACLTSIQDLEGVQSLVCVVDNGSADNTRAAVRRVQARPSHSCRIELLALPENQGTTKSRNLGIRRIPADYPYLCILDSDTVVTTEAVTDLIRVLDETPDSGIVGPRLIGPDGTVQPSARRIPLPWVKLLKAAPVKAWRKKAEAWEALPGREEDVQAAGYLMSACWLMRRALVETVGYLDERIFYAPEDVEYCIRVWKHGLRVLYDKRAAVRHEWQRLSRKKRFSRHNWEHIKGLLHMYRKHRIWLCADEIERRLQAKEGETRHENRTAESALQN